MQGYEQSKLAWKENQHELIQRYIGHKDSFINGLLPELAIAVPAGQLVSILQGRLGTNTFKQCLDPSYTHPSPVSGHESPDWLRRCNIVGINVRTIHSFFNVVKYALTLPKSQSGIHLLPIWEPGVVSSLYGIASWQVNPEFFSHEMQESFPQLDTVERQLKVSINLLHAMGKTVGMDVIPHTDRFSEVVLANPQHFEWLQRAGDTIISHDNDLHLVVQDAIMQFLKRQDSLLPSAPADSRQFFGEEFGEQQRLLALFGGPFDYEQRRIRREALLDDLYRLSFEPVPATMAPPYRGLEIDLTTVTRDDKGREWVDYAISQPTSMSRVFGPLTRFKFYENKDDNRKWEIDFEKPRPAVWAYFQEKYAWFAREYAFDFMRGDMSHVQMRPEGVPAHPDAWYDPLGAVKTHVQREKPWFGYFAESFLGPAGYLAYGDEVDHLEAARADTTLGDLQSMVVGEPEFLQNFRWYLDILATRKVTPCFTVMTADKDDPRFDEFYHGGNEARLFIGLLLPDMPSYMGLGFECRDLHLEPAPNEHYTKLFVFKILEGPKATSGSYIWGKNTELFKRLLRIRTLAEDLLPEIADCHARWLLPPDPTGHKKVIAWTLEENRRLLFVVNLNWKTIAREVKVPCPLSFLQHWELHFSTAGSSGPPLYFSGINLALPDLQPGEGRIYRCPEKAVHNRHSAALE